VPEDRLSPRVDTADPEQVATRLAVLRRRLDARTDRAGNALPRFRENVAEMQGEIARLEGVQNG
jgi:hypothetical protein